MATNKYSTGKIYRLVNTVDIEEYVGSTTQSLIQRKAGHKRKAISVPNRKVYQHLNSVGWDNVEIVLIENYPCESKEELNARERYWIESLKPSLNRNIPTRTTKEWFDDNTVRVKEYKAQWQSANKERLKDMKAKYYEANKETFKEKGAQYYHANIDKIKENQSQYYSDNADKIKDRCAKYREQNADKIKEYKREYYLRKKAEREAQQ